LQNISVSDLAKEISSLKTEVASLRRDLDILQQEVETWISNRLMGQTRNNIIKERIESIPPPLEDAPFELLSKKNLHQNYRESKECRSCLFLIRNIMSNTILKFVMKYLV
jgi:hypothetical protein